MNDRELAQLADPEKDQHFLTNPAKLQYILDAAAIRSTDHVLELGAGAGTVARVLPEAASLTLVELDYRLIPALKSNAPEYASVVNSDGVELLRRGALRFDVLLSNLPHNVTVELATLLPRTNFRVGVLAAGSIEPFKRLRGSIKYRTLTKIQGDDFVPRQIEESLLVLVRPKNLKETALQTKEADLSGDLVRTSEAASALGVSARSLARWAADGQVSPDLVTPGGHMRWRIANLAKQLKAIN